jgi:hypothetical protein
MNYQEIGYKLPPEYASLVYLHQRLGDVETVDAACYIWNRLHTGDTLRVNKVDEKFGTIWLTGKCVELESALDICKYITTFGVTIDYTRTIVTKSWEV